MEVVVMTADKLQEAVDQLRAAIAYALDRPGGEGLEWLRAWNEGDQEAIDEVDKFVMDWR